MAGTSLAASPAPTLAWSLIVRDRNLTGPWAGFSFKAGRLVTPKAASWNRKIWPGRSQLRRHRNGVG